MPNKMKPFDRINEVLKTVRPRKIAAHEFGDVHLEVEEGNVPMPTMRSGRQFVGYSEATIARRLREYAADGKVTVGTREGKNFKEYGYIGVAAEAPAVGA